MVNNIFDPIRLSNMVRRHVLKMCHAGGSSHVASCLSMADIISCTYSTMKFDPHDPNWPGRDYFILSKGHAGATVYATLSELGFFDKSNLDLHYQNGSTMSGHVSHVGNPGIEFSTGSLGHGLPVACGIAYSFKISSKANQVFCIVSDGELGEGSNWEAALFASQHKLDNLTVLVDRNRLQSIKDTEDTLALEPLHQKFEAFGWNVISVDGHDHETLLSKLSEKSLLPKIIICRTTKGKGVTFMENKVEWHYRSPNKKELTLALEQIPETPLAAPLRGES